MKPLKVPATLDSLGTIADYVMQAAASVSLDRRAAYRLRLAVDEIVTNIIVHGYAEAGLQGDLQLQYTADCHTLQVAIEDTGARCDPRELPPPDIHLPPEERPIGGLGAYLALQSVDKFEYECLNGKNRNVLIMNLPVSTPGT